ncbi:Lrp/AsnC family transcriptional regulator [Salinimonas marina]|uniref:Leucine-responsive regulatory protein n=1 Tax=Salinimonas marina TaxID=2785918 RepID=A0A7S9HEI9_9ALTE|nr:Lrp/AsnC family transcriptional regulator [Salinimonas marina]QPG06721.1 Lrp/AsnC family transcriptional regulator [Salinimonas marina]
MKYDHYTDQILQILQKDGRISNTELAERIGLSASACLRRVQEMERSKVISGYRAVVNQAKLGRGFVAYVSVGLNEHTTASQRAFENAVALSREVRECHNITGAFEYLLRVETSDIQAYKQFHADVLGAIVQVSTITTHVVMDSAKDERA